MGWGGWSLGVVEVYSGSRGGGKGVVEVKGWWDQVVLGSRGGRGLGW